MATRAYDIDAMLPDPLPAEPMPLARAWYDEAVRLAMQPNPNAMTVATVDADGRPSLRVVLCRGWDMQTGAVTFFTNRTSRKGRALDSHAHAAADFFWDHLNRQLIVEGPVTPSTDAENDAYFRRRPLISRIAAWASDQSRPIESRHALLEKTRQVCERFGVDLERDTDAEIPRPPHWGGYRIWAERIELWISGPGRVHDRAAWTRKLVHEGDIYNAGPWSATRLQP